MQLLWKSRVEHCVLQLRLQKGQALGMRMKPKVKTHPKLMTKSKMSHTTKA